MNNTVNTDKKQVTTIQDKRDAFCDCLNDIQILVKLVNEKALQMVEAHGLGQEDYANELSVLNHYLTTQLADKFKELSELKEQINL
ncbi:hypothetical protein AB9M75_12505 [Lactobacillus sp. AN1001]